MAEQPVIKHRYAGKEQMTIISYSLVYKDVFSLAGFLAVLHEWLVDNGYCTRDDSAFREDFYLQRESPKSGKQIQIRWRVMKTPPPGSLLWRYEFDIDIDVRGLQEAELMHKGKKLTVDKGELEVDVTGNLVVDYEKAWENHPWLKKYKKFIIYKLLRKKLNAQKGEVEKDGNRLQEAIKEYLKLQMHGAPQFQEFLPKRPPE